MVFYHIYDSHLVISVLSPVHLFAFFFHLSYKVHFVFLSYVVVGCMGYTVLHYTVFANVPPLPKKVLPKPVLTWLIFPHFRNLAQASTAAEHFSLTFAVKFNILVVSLNLIILLSLYCSQFIDISVFITKYNCARIAAMSY